MRISGDKRKRHSALSSSSGNPWSWMTSWNHYKRRVIRGVANTSTIARSCCGIIIPHNERSHAAVDGNGWPWKWMTLRYLMTLHALPSLVCRFWSIINGYSDNIPMGVSSSRGTWKSVNASRAPFCHHRTRPSPPPSYHIDCNIRFHLLSSNRIPQCTIVPTFAQPNSCSFSSWLKASTPDFGLWKIN